MKPTADEATVHLHLGARDVELRWKDAQSAPDGEQRRTLPLGLARLQQLHRFTRPPRPLALEGAIESIEDAVMPLARAVPAGARLVLDPAQAPAGLVEALGEPDFDLAAVEATFSRLSDLALGRPAAQAGVPEAPDFAIALLIVREALHHLPLHGGRWQAGA